MFQILVKVTSRKIERLLKEKKGDLTWDEFMLFVSKHSPDPCVVCLGTGSVSLSKDEIASCHYCSGTGLKGSEIK